MKVGTPGQPFNFEPDAESMSKSWIRAIHDRHDDQLTKILQYWNQRSGARALGLIQQDDIGLPLLIETIRLGSHEGYTLLKADLCTHGKALHQLQRDPLTWLTLYSNQHVWMESEILHLLEQGYPIRYDHLGDWTRSAAHCAVTFGRLSVLPHLLAHYTLVQFNAEMPFWKSAIYERTTQSGHDIKTDQLYQLLDQAYAQCEARTLHHDSVISTEASSPPLALRARF